RRVDAVEDDAAIVLVEGEASARQFERTAGLDAGDAGYGPTAKRTVDYGVAGQLVAFAERKVVADKRQATVADVKHRGSLVELAIAQSQEVVGRSGVLLEQIAQRMAQHVARLDGEAVARTAQFQLEGIVGRIRIVGHQARNGARSVRVRL